MPYELYYVASYKILIGLLLRVSLILLIASGVVLMLYELVRSVILERDQ